MMTMIFLLIKNKILISQNIYFSLIIDLTIYKKKIIMLIKYKDYF